jgi:hypothetical protein
MGLVRDDFQEFVGGIDPVTVHIRLDYYETRRYFLRRRGSFVKGHPQIRCLVPSQSLTKMFPLFCVAANSNPPQKASPNTYIAIRARTLQASNSKERRI